MPTPSSAYCDGGERHYLVNRLEEFDDLMYAGVGLVCLHYAVEVPKGPAGHSFLNWMGGYFEPFWSVNPHWTANFHNLPVHPITRGVKPFEINDEWYYHMRFQPEMKGITPILTDMPPRETLNREDGHHSGNPFVREAVLQRQEPQHVAWAYDRPAGGRSFGFTGGHFHANWQDDNFRKIVLNAIVWTTGLDVPDEGMKSATPTQEELEANQDFPNPKQNAQLEPPQRPRERRGKARAPEFSSPVVTSATPGHSVKVDVPIAGAKKLYLVATDGRNGFSCDWCDWAEPRLIGPDGEQKLTDLKWSAANSEWGQVRVGANADGGLLRIDGNPVAEGIGTHANSIIEYDLPEGHKFTRFMATAGLDNGGTDQAGGRESSVQFHVMTQRPARAFLLQVASTSTSDASTSHDLDEAISQLDVHPDLEVSIFAGEPQMSNPTNIDIDHLGRVWICEVINYRRFRNTDMPERKEGDRILILEDTNGDGVADAELDVLSGSRRRLRPTASACCRLRRVTGTKALISARMRSSFSSTTTATCMPIARKYCSPDSEEPSTITGFMPSSSVRTASSTSTSATKASRSRMPSGKPIIDKAGNEVNNSRNPYQEGMVVPLQSGRQRVRDARLELPQQLGSWPSIRFGTIWQSDNDDDGNRGMRINYVMEFGNYGYKDEITGAGWQEPRTGMSEEIPLRHWHLNDPGVVPNLLQTGAGSPTGICVYEGSTCCRSRFENQLIHCDAGPNIVRAYPVTVHGAGYPARDDRRARGDTRSMVPSVGCLCRSGWVAVRGRLVRSGRRWSPHAGRRARPTVPHHPQGNGPFGSL